MSLTSYQAAPPRVLKRALCRIERRTQIQKLALRFTFAAKTNRIAGVGKKGKSESRILVGTASWSDPGFVEHWYPKKMPAGERLAWYAQHFALVEVNSSFYSVPDARLVERWCAMTPDGFVFDVKLHQLLSRNSTNRKLLAHSLQKIAETDAKGRVNLKPKIERAMIAEFRRPLEILRREMKLGALLLQLSPGFSPRK